MKAQRCLVGQVVGKGLINMPRDVGVADGWSRRTAHSLRRQWRGRRHRIGTTQNLARAARPPRAAVGLLNGSRFLRVVGRWPAGSTARQKFFDLPLQPSPVTGPHLDQFTWIKIFTAQLVEDFAGRKTAWRHWGRRAAATDGLRLLTLLGRPPEDGKHLRENPEPDKQRRKEALQPIESGGKHGQGHIGTSQTRGSRRPGFV